MGRWFDELRVGDRFETHGRTLTEADLVGFAALTGDWNPVMSTRPSPRRCMAAGSRTGPCSPASPLACCAATT
jgi:hypothetical protein